MALRSSYSDTSWKVVGSSLGNVILFWLILTNSLRGWVTKKSDCRLEACRLKSKKCLTFLTDWTIRLKGPTVNIACGKNAICPIASMAERLSYRVAGWKDTGSNLGVVFLFDWLQFKYFVRFCKPFLHIVVFEVWQLYDNWDFRKNFCIFLLRKKVTNSWFSLSFYFLM